MTGMGRLLRSGTASCVIGVNVSQIDAPSFGGMVRIPLDNGLQIYGLIFDIRVQDDGLVRQLATSPEVSEAVIADNRRNRTVPVEISVLFIGHALKGEISHLLPPRPPLSLDMIYACGPDELCCFTNAGRFGYFRHILRSLEAPAGELIAAHLREAHRAHCGQGNPGWAVSATQELITLLRDDYPTLMSVLGALADANLSL